MLVVQEHDPELYDLIQQERMRQVSAVRARKPVNTFSSLTLLHTFCAHVGCGCVHTFPRMIASIGALGQREKQSCHPASCYALNRHRIDLDHSCCCAWEHVLGDLRQCTPEL